MRKFTNKKIKGFSLIQLMIILLMIAITIAATMPLITRKFKVVPRPALHGKWACIKDVDGKLLQAGARDGTSSLPPIGTPSWKFGCDFPVLPSEVDYLLIQVVGGGAGGQAAGVETKPKGETSFLTKDEYIVEDEAKYKITLTGEFGDAPSLLRGSGDVYNFFAYYYVLSGNSWAKTPLITAQCYSTNYQAAPAGSNVTMTFEKFLKRGDSLKLEYLNSAKKVDSIDKSAMCADEKVGPNQAFLLMPSGKWEPYDADWTFILPLADNSSANGMDLRFLYNYKSYAEIVGSSSGKWTGNLYEKDVPRCRAVACSRYVPVSPRTISGCKATDTSAECDAKIANNLIKNKPVNVENYLTHIGMISSTEPAANSITLLEDVHTYKGGCGGANGESVAVLMQVSGNSKLEIDPLLIGGGGSASTGISDYSPGKPGGTTTFAGVSARGGMGCATSVANGPERSNIEGKGGYGASAPTNAPKDSIGGKGAYFADGKAVHATFGNGIGAGGGGGGGKTIDDEPAFALAGAGHGGGIIVSW